MDSSKDKEIYILETWCEQAIYQFRKEYESLDSCEKSCVVKFLSLLAPSQIEIFWVSHPTEFQLVVVFHDPDRKDQEIIINGPYWGNELEKEVINLMDEPRWRKELRYTKPDGDWISEYDFDAGNQEHKYSDYFVNPFSQFLNILRNSPLIQFKEGILMGSPFGDEDFCKIIRGNIASLDRIDLLSDTLDSARQEGVRRRTRNPNEKTPYSGDKKGKKYINLVGAYYCPGLYISDSCELSFKEKLYGLNILEHQKYDHKFTFGNKTGYFTKYGLVLIPCNSEPDAIQKLNLIFAISLVKGFPALSVRSTELLRTKIEENTDPLGQGFGGLSGGNPNTKRFTLGDIQGQRKKVISLEQMYEIIKNFETVWKNDSLLNYLLYLIESHTHLENKEYSQSYLYSWLIVEQDIANRFEQILDQKSMSSKRKGKFSNHDKWSSDNKIEFLNLYGAISDEEYTELIEWNLKRNKFAHKGFQIDKKLAKSLYNRSSEIVKQELSDEMDRSD